MEKLRAIDSHTVGEPTRVLIDGPEIPGDHIEAKAEAWAGRLDGLRRAVCLEPRGWEAIVGCHVSTSTRDDCDYDAVFFNNVGTIGMCGHGTIGLAVTLAHQGMARPGPLRINTVAGPVECNLLDKNTCSIRNVVSWFDREVEHLPVVGLGPVSGKIAYGGNWFFLVDHFFEDLAETPVSQLTSIASRVMDALDRDGIRATGGARIDHIELFGPPTRKDADSLNFVLCPGRAFDRSPCGTGTSAKIACLARTGEVSLGDVLRQQGIAGGVFDASYILAEDGGVIPTITGKAWVTAESVLCFDPTDEMRGGLAWA